MPDRREDDKIDPITGIPVSAAHEAIYTHIDDSCAMVMKHQDRIIEDFEVRHIGERHATLIAGETAKEVKEAAADMKTIMPGLLDFIYGPPKIDPVTNEPLIDADGHYFRNEQKGAQHAVNNGGFKATIPKWLTAIIIALIGTSGTVGVAVIQHNSDTQHIVQDVVEELQQLQEEIETP